MAIALTTMLPRLGLILGDPQEEEFGPALKLELLNDGQNEFIRLLDPECLNALKTLAEDNACDETGAFDLSGLTDAVFGNGRGIILVRFSNDGYPIYMVSEKEWRRFEKEDRSWDLTHGICLRRGTSLLVKPFSAADVASGSIEEDTVYKVIDYTSLIYNTITYTTGQTFTGVAGQTDYGSEIGTGSVIAATLIDLTYTKQPDIMALDSTGDDTKNTNCELEDDYARVIIGLSVKEFKSRNQRTKDAYEGALAQVRSINRSARHTDSVAHNVDYDDPYFYPEDNARRRTIRTQQYEE